MSTVFTKDAVVCTITKNPTYPRKWWTDRYNQYFRETADGGTATYDNGPNIIKGILVINNVPKDEVDNATTGLRKFLRDTVIFQQNSFVITPPTNTDLGKGDNTNITVFYNGGPTLDGVFTFIRPGTFYDIVLPYREDVS